MLKDKKIRGILQLLLGLALLVWLVNRVGLVTIVQTLSGLHWGWYLAAFLLFQVNMVLRSYRWYLLQSALDKRPPFLQLVYLYYLGFFFNNFIPSGFGGDVVKVVGLRQEYGRGTEALSSVLMDRLIGLLGSSLIALAMLVWSSSSAWLDQIALPPLLIVSVAAISIGVPVGLLVFRFSNPLNWIASYFPFTRPLVANARLMNLAGTIRRYPLTNLLASLLTSLPFTLNLMFIQFDIARALAAAAPLYLFALFVPIISLVNLLPLSFNGLGAREGVYLLLFVPVGVLPEQAISMSLAFYFLRVCTGIIGGLLYMFKSST